MHAFVIEAVPAGAHGPFAVALEIQLAIVGRGVVLAGDVVDIADARALIICMAVSNSDRLGRLSNVARVQHKVRRPGHGVDLVYGELQGSGHILVGGLVEADVAVADLNEAETCCSFGRLCAAAPGVAAKSLDVGTPPAMVQSKPVPAHAMQLRKLRRSMPSFTGSLGIRLGCEAAAGSLVSARCCSGVPFWVSFMGRSSTDENSQPRFYSAQHGINLPETSSHV